MAYRQNGFTPLMQSVGNKNTKAVTLLLDFGAAINTSPSEVSFRFLVNACE